MQDSGRLEEEEKDLSRVREEQQQQQAGEVKHQESSREEDRREEIGPSPVPCDHAVSVQEIWHHIKSNLVKNLQPSAHQTRQAKRFVSPSVRECLDIYEKPTAIDKFTGKPIPLSKVLSRSKRPDSLQGDMSIFNAAMNQVARENQVKAEVILKQKKDSYNSMDVGKQQSLLDQYFNFDHSNNAAAAGSSKVEDSSSKDSQKSESLVLPRRIKGGTSPAIKKKLPAYLRSDGTVVSGSLERIGSDLLSCGPSHRGRMWNDYDKEAKDQERSSVFLTDMRFPSFGASRKETVYDATTSDNSILKMSNKFKSKGWQPLSTSALLEHTKVSEMPVKGLGAEAHGKYHLWRPNTAIA